MSNKSFFIIAILGVIVSVFISSRFLSSQIIFNFDQARDAFETYAIWHNHDLKILGPSSDIPGVHHGVLWYYLLSIPYAIRTTPVSPAIAFALLVFLTIPLCAYFTQKLYKNTGITATAVALYALSPLFIAFTHWLSNPIIGVFVSPLILISIWQFILGKKRIFWSATIGLLFGLLIQADFAWGLFLFTIPFYLHFYRIKPSFGQVILFMTGISLACSSFLVSEIRFGGKAIHGLADYLSNLNSISGPPTNAILSSIDRITNGIRVMALPLPYLAIFLLLIYFFYKLFKKPEAKPNPTAFLFIWTGAIIIFQFFSGGFISAVFMFAPLLMSTVILLGAMINKAFNGKTALAVIVVILIFDINISLSWLRNNYSPLSVQAGMVYQLEKQIVDYTFQAANMQPFTITTITNPLFINTVWAWHYQTYGQDTYGYVPYWQGRNQEGYLGNLPAKQFGTDTLFLIKEPDEGIPEVYVTKIIYEADKVSDIVEEKKFGDFLVQKRRFNPKKVPPAIPPTLIGNKYLLDEIVL